MQKIGFEEAVNIVVAEDSRYEADAYVFLRDALEFTIKQVKRETGASQHVRGEELLHGFRKYALQEYGPMALTVLEEWGISCTSDVGEMVFNLIEAGVFGRSDVDERKDFENIYDFDAAFVAPFLPDSERNKGVEEGC